MERHNTFFIMTKRKRSTVLASSIISNQNLYALNHHMDAMHCRHTLEWNHGIVSFQMLRVYAFQGAKSKHLFIFYFSV